MSVVMGRVVLDCNGVDILRSVGELRVCHDAVYNNFIVNWDHID